jgi:hypothetical protein
MINHHKKLTIIIPLLIVATISLIPARVQKDIINVHDLLMSDFIAWILTYSDKRTPVQVEFTNIDFRIVEIRSVTANKSFNLLYIQTLREISNIIDLQDVFISILIVLPTNKSGRLSIGLSNIVAENHYYVNLTTLTVHGNYVGESLINTSSVREVFSSINKSYTRLQINLDPAIEEIMINITFYHYSSSYVGYILYNNQCLLVVIFCFLSVFYKFTAHQFLFILSLSVTISLILLCVFDHPINIMFQTFPEINLAGRPIFDLGVFLTILLMLLRKGWSN